MRTIAVLGVAWCVAGLAGCASSSPGEAPGRPVAEAAPRPEWLTKLLAWPHPGGARDEVVEAAAADPMYLEWIEKATRAGEPREARNLASVLAGIDYRQRRIGNLNLARRMYRIDPLNHAHTLIWLAQHRYFEETEVEMLRLAFEPVEIGAESSVRWNVSGAAAYLVQRLAFDAKTLPRQLPAGVGAMTVNPNNARLACLQHIIRAAYAQPDWEASVRTAEACLKDELCAPVGDHEVADCETVLSRLRGGT